QPTTPSLHDALPISSYTPMCRGYVHQCTTLVSQAVTINKPATIASILETPLRAKARVVPASTRRTIGAVQSGEKKPVLTPMRSSSGKIAKLDQLRNVTTIDTMPRALRQLGSSCRKLFVQPR